MTTTAVKWPRCPFCDNPFVVESVRHSGDHGGATVTVMHDCADFGIMRSNPHHRVIGWTPWSGRSDVEVKGQQLVAELLQSRLSQYKKTLPETPE